MVFYTCSGCGESLKKNKVEKHVYTCRGCEYLTCIDCGKDFYGDDYKGHNQCITEDQKYSAKGTEFKPNKGDVKQQLWLQNIENAMSLDTNLSKKALDLISDLKNYDNIPRKRPKFLNFLKNSLRIYDAKLGEEVWEAFSSASKKDNLSNNNTKPATENNKMDLDCAKSGDRNDKSADITPPQTDEDLRSDSVTIKKKVKKSKKRKLVEGEDGTQIKNKKVKSPKKESSENTNDEAQIVASLDNESSTRVEMTMEKKTKKKRKVQSSKNTTSDTDATEKKEKKSNDQSTEVQPNLNISERHSSTEKPKILNSEGNVSGSKKKSKKKKPKIGDETSEAMAGNLKCENDHKKTIDGDLSINKKTKNGWLVSELASNGNDSSNGFEVKKKKKKKHKISNNGDCESIQNGGCERVIPVANLVNENVAVSKIKKKRKIELVENVTDSAPTCNVLKKIKKKKRKVSEKIVE